ncbi:hypothetical protein [Holospora curviuscula]|uniref:hypothetical protein n=1 Tax=Holospora curviuscula TaxID=1082868 RepID=UPI001A9C3CFD|nr:hypothetical protein [Holospora curviuscula]
MGAHHCEINYDPLRISICCQSTKNYLPQTGFGASYKSFVNPRAFPVRFWQGTSR